MSLTLTDHYVNGLYPLTYTDVHREHILCRPELLHSGPSIMIPVCLIPPS